MSIVDRIEQMSVYHLQLPVRSVRSHGSGNVAQQVDVVLLRLTTAGGLVGWGEASPWAVFTGTAEANAAALDRYLRPHIIGADIGRINDIMATATQSIVGHGEAKAALETALYDLLGKACGQPLAVLLGGLYRDRIPLSFSVADPDFNKDLQHIERLYSEGIRLFKVKTGFAGHQFDLDRLEQLRKKYSDIDLRVDYNQGLEPWNALAKLQDIASFKPTFIEQPVAARHFAAMAQFTAALTIPVMADESVFNSSDMLRAIDQKICHCVSIKIMKSGGITEAQKVANIAAAAGIAAYGGDMFETGLAHLAGTHMIAATPAISLGCEFYQAREYLQHDVLTQPFPVTNGDVIVPHQPGLGIEVDENIVQRFTVAQR